MLDWRRRLGPNGRAPLTSSFLWIQPSIEAWSDDLHRGQGVEVDSGDLGGEAGQTARSVGIRSSMIVPAQVGDDVWGYVCFVDRHGKKRWTDHEKWVLMTVAAGIAGAVKQRRVEEAYREGQDRLRGIVENALDLICELGEDGRYVYASPSHASTMGYSTEDLLGRDFFEFIHSDERMGAKGVSAGTGHARPSISKCATGMSGAWRMLGSTAPQERDRGVGSACAEDITWRKQARTSC